MSSRLAKLFVVMTLIFAVGAHWTVLQSIAWVGMAVNYSQTSTLKDALEKTFDGKHPCALCKTIARVRQTDKKDNVQTELKKLDLLNQPLVVFLISPIPFVLPGQRGGLAPSLSQTPPVPPPRFLSV